MTMHVVTQVMDYGPGLSESDADVRLRIALWKAIDYYVAHGYGGEVFLDARIDAVRYVDEPSGLEGFKARRIEADVEFVT